MQTRLLYHFNVRLFVRAIAQLRMVDRNVALYTVPTTAEQQRLFTQLLLSYKLNPQTVFFLGYSDNYLGEAQTALTQLDRTLFLKLGYALVF